MDEENKQEEQNKAESKPEGERRGPRVHLFGAEVNSGEWDGKSRAERKEAWRARKDEWKQAHREQREQWKMQHREWREEHGHGGGIFFGMILLFAGVVALLYMMGFISHVFWYAILPFWPILLILWGASIILGHHWFARFILFLFALAFLIIIIFYGMVKSGSPLVSSLSPSVVSAIQNSQAPQY